MVPVDSRTEEVTPPLSASPQRMGGATPPTSGVSRSMDGEIPSFTEVSPRVGGVTAPPSGVSSRVGGVTAPPSVGEERDEMGGMDISEGMPETTLQPRGNSKVTEV